LPAGIGFLGLFQSVPFGAFRPGPLPPITLAR
jgi:hypothetical protein